MASMHPAVTLGTLSTPLRLFQVQPTFSTHTVRWALSRFNDAMIGNLDRLILDFLKIVQVANSMTTPIAAFIFLTNNEAFTNVSLALSKQPHPFTMETLVD